MVMKICPKWKMDSAAELALKNLYVQKKIEKISVNRVSISGGSSFSPPERITHFGRPSFRGSAESGPRWWGEKQHPLFLGTPQTVQITKRPIKFNRWW